MEPLVVLRVLVSLACVFGLLWFVARRARGGTVATRRAPALSVVARQSLGGRSAVALVEVAGRHLLLGVGEHGVTLLTEVEAARPLDGERVELDTSELEKLLAEEALLAVHGNPDDSRDDVPVPPPSSPAARMPAVPTPRNPLEGSILDATTWRRAVEAVQERTLRR